MKSWLRDINREFPYLQISSVELSFRLRDMHTRVSLWCSMNDLGWPLPPREPLSKAELIEEERLRESMIEARKQATAEEMEAPSRAVRVIVGFKL